MNNLENFVNGIGNMISKVARSPEYKRTSEVLSQPPRDYTAEYAQEVQLEIEARDHIPKQSLHRLTEIEESTRMTNEELGKFRKDFSRLDEDFSDFKRSQQAWFIPWIGIAIGFVALVVSLCALYKH